MKKKPNLDDFSSFCNSWYDRCSTAFRSIRGFVNKQNSFLLLIVGVLITGVIITFFAFSNVKKEVGTAIKELKQETSKAIDSTSFDWDAIWSNQWLHLLGVLFIVSLIVYLLVRFKAFKNFSIKGISMFLVWTAIGAVALVVILWATGTSKDFITWIKGKEVDNSAMVPRVPVKSMSPGTYTEPTSLVGIAVYHDRAQYFRPIANGKRIRFVLRSCTDTTKYLDQSVEITSTGTIPDHNIITYHNSFDIEYEWYTFTLIEGEGVTFSYKGLPSR